MIGQYYKDDGHFRVFDDKGSMVAEFNNLETRFMAEPKFHDMNLKAVGCWSRTEWGWERKLTPILKRNRLNCVWRGCNRKPTHIYFCKIHAQKAKDALMDDEN